MVDSTDTADPRAAETRIPCPHCAEPILPAARVCPFCRLHVADVPAAPNKGAGGTILKVLLIVVVLLALGFCALAEKGRQAGPRASLADVMSVRWQGGFVYVQSRAPLDGCRLELNDRFVQTATIVSGVEQSFLMSTFAAGDGARFNVAVTKPLTLWVNCSGSRYDGALFRFR